MRRIEELVSELAEKDVKLSIERDILRCDAPAGVLTQGLRAELAERKVEILEFLRRFSLTSQTREAIPSVSREGSIPLSFAQQRLWFLDQLEGPTAIYNVPVAIRLTGPLCVSALGQALDEIVGRHEALRTTFLTVEGQPVQVIGPVLVLHLPIVDLQGMPENEQATAVLEVALAEGRRPFDLARGPLVRATLLYQSPQKHVLLITMHHIVSDGWSAGVLLRELAGLYTAFLLRQPSPLPELPIQYADFASWQRNWLTGTVLETQLAYWKRQLAGVPTLLALPADHPRPAVQTFGGRTTQFVINHGLTMQLRALSCQNGASLFITLFAVFVALLSRYTRQEDLVVGTFIANRNRRELEPLIGFFVNTLALRVDLSGNPTFSELLDRVRQVVLDAQTHQDIPFERLVEELRLERDLSRPPLFQVAFNWQPIPIDRLRASNLTIAIEGFDFGVAKFDLTMSLAETGQGLLGAIEYNTDLFDAVRIARMAEHYQILAAGIVDCPQKRIADLPLLTGPERHRLFIEWNDTAVRLSEKKCLHALFEKQVERTPEAVALAFQDEHLTYRQLNERANQLAGYLRRLGVGPELLVGICMERSLEMIVGILGILKVGGAYLPLDPAYPKERLEFMLEDTQAPVLLTLARLANQLPEFRGRVVCLDRDWDELAKESKANAPSGVSAENLAYVIYTSGSTGNPKGVMIRHCSIVNLAVGLYHAIYEPHSTAPLRVSLNGPIIFDTSVKQLIQLLYGHTLIILSEDVRTDGTMLLSYLRQNAIDVLDCTPSQLRLLLPLALATQAGNLPSNVLVGGELIEESIWNALIEITGTNFYNVYGPTECTVDATVCPVSMSDKPTIGRPIANTQVYILGPHMQPVPIGVPGELHIGGSGLARGYLGRPELTAEKFVPNPFNHQAGARLYKTGDLARYLPDGNIEFLGRIDHQVKIRGFRIELQEIEASLRQHPAVRESVVILRETRHGDSSLAAYIVPDQQRAFTIWQWLALERESEVGGRAMLELPNGLFVAHICREETESRYKEIFEDSCYLRHGITLKDGDCVFDIGANIGLFTLFVGQRFPDARIYAFELNQMAFEALRLNAALYGLDMRAFECELGNESGMAISTPFPNLSIQFGRWGKAIRNHMVVRTGPESQLMLTVNEKIADKAPAERLLGKQVTDLPRSVSDVMRDNEVDRIDLLKISVEKGELWVLAGIAETDWPRIRQIVVRVYRKHKQLDRIAALLKAHGYSVAVELDRLSKDEGLYSIYATRAGAGGEPPAATANHPAREPKQVWSSPARLRNDLRDWLREKLPEYMVPTTIDFLDALPLTPNGKLDRRALPVPKADQMGRTKHYVAPRNEKERWMAAVWAEVLSVDKVGIDDNFFALGGESLKAVRVVYKLENLVTVMDLFKHQTIRELAEHLSLQPRRKALLYELTPSPQQRRTLSLVCVPGAGGNAIVFKPLADALPEGYALYAVELPGHDPSYPDETLQPWSEVAPRCAAEIKRLIQGPVALYGHSSGVSLVLEIARLLEAEHVELVGLYLGANFPHMRISGKLFQWLNIERWQSNRVYEDWQRVTVGSLFEDFDPQAKASRARSWRHDNLQNEDYYTEAYTVWKGKKLHTPILSIVGEMDWSTEFYREQVKDWLMFGEAVELAVIPHAGHYFLKHQAKELAEVITHQHIAWKYRVRSTSDASMTVSAPSAKSQPEATSHQKGVQPHLYLTPSDVESEREQGSSLNAFLTVAVGQFVSMIGTALTSFALGIWVYRQTGSVSNLALLSTFAILPTILLLPVAGAIVDRWDRRKIMLWGDLIAAASVLTLALLLWIGSLQLWHLLLVTALQSIVGAFKQPAYIAAVCQLVPKRYLGQANGFVQLGNATGGVFAPLFGGLLVVLVDLHGIVLIDMATYLFAVTTLLLIEFPNRLFHKEDEPLTRAILGGWHYLTKRRGLMAIVVYFAALNLSISFFSVLVTPLVLSFDSPALLGRVLSALSLGMLTGSLTMILWGGTKQRTDGLIGAGLLYGIFVMITGLQSSPINLYLGLFGAGASYAFVGGHFFPILQVKVGQGLQGRVLAIMRMMAFSSMPVALILVGPLTDKIFEPLLVEGGSLAGTIGQIIGVGPGRGMGLMVVLAGSMMVIWSLLAFRYRPLRYLENELPDATVRPVIYEDKDLLQEEDDRQLRARTRYEPSLKYQSQ